LARRAIAGVEAVDAVTSTYRRTVVIDGVPGILEIRPGGRDHLEARLPPGADGTVDVLRRVRRIFALDHEPEPAIAHLSADPVLAALLAARPGLRVPGTWDPYETGVRA